MQIRGILNPFVLEIIAHAMYKTELASLSRLIVVDYALMAQFYKLLSQFGFTYLWAGFSLGYTCSVEEQGSYISFCGGRFLSCLRPEH